MAFFRVTDDDGKEYYYPAQKIYDDLELDHYDDTGRLYHWEAVTDDDEILSSDDLLDNVEFFEDDDDELPLDSADFYGDLVELDDFEQGDDDSEDDI